MMLVSLDTCETEREVCARHDSGMLIEVSVSRVEPSQGGERVWRGELGLASKIILEAPVYSR